MSNVAVATLECKTRERTRDADIEVETSGNEGFHIFDMDFFDEESLVIVYQSYAEEGTLFSLFHLVHIIVREIPDF